MKLKPIKRKSTPVEEPKKEKKATQKLPPDVYKPMFDPIRFLVKEEPSMKDETKMVKQYIELSVKRFDDDSAKPTVFCTMYQESDFYTGYLKGKTIYFPLDSLADVLENLNELSDKCDEEGITE